MKLLLTSGVCSNIYEKEAFLKSKGIAIYISDQGGAAMKAGVEIGLWVVLDNQYDEAKNLLLNKSYIVKNPLSLDEIQKIEININQPFFKFTDKFLNNFIIFVLVLIVTFIVYRVLRSLWL